MAKHGGKRAGSGRKPKTDEQKLIEKLSPLEDTAHTALESALNIGESWAVKLYFQYMYGNPKSQVDVTSNGDSISIQIQPPKDS